MNNVNRQYQRSLLENMGKYATMGGTVGAQAGTVIIGGILGYSVVMGLDAVGMTAGAAYGAWNHVFGE